MRTYVAHCYDCGGAPDSPDHDPQSGSQIAHPFRVDPKVAEIAAAIHGFSRDPAAGEALGAVLAVFSLMSELVDAAYPEGYPGRELTP